MIASISRTTSQGFSLSSSLSLSQNQLKIKKKNSVKKRHKFKHSVYLIQVQVYGPCNYQTTEAAAGQGVHARNLWAFPRCKKSLILRPLLMSRVDGQPTDIPSYGSAAVEFLGRGCGRRWVSLHPAHPALFQLQPRSRSRPP